MIQRARNVCLDCGNPEREEERSAGWDSPEDGGAHCKGMVVSMTSLLLGRPATRLGRDSFVAVAAADADADTISAAGVLPFACEVTESLAKLERLSDVDQDGRADEAPRMSTAVRHRAASSVSSASSVSMPTSAVVPTIRIPLVAADTFHGEVHGDS